MALSGLKKWQKSQLKLIFVSISRFLITSKILWRRFGEEFEARLDLLRYLRFFEDLGAEVRVGLTRGAPQIAWP
jgi:hypothetical protein